MENVGKIRLHQNAWVVAKLQFTYLDGGKMIHTDGSPGVALGNSVTLDPSEFGVPEGASVSAYIFVVWGNDNHGKEIFTMVHGSPNIADYTLEGTTLGNTLTYNGMKQK
ncbi:hypothetical protein GA0070606_4834 [Micromonospora citrea]|uniref:Uncharacterized protein n=1 Tax=Micromonospora citrea TaxID=47855 RepID=A0A1C6VR22_9ACTN|nr:hypothetical protein [Micromonospora citrea]SCL68637.1 hypothetical protein GA0070606_4834 [Micromonospora citrea]